MHPRRVAKHLAFLSVIILNLSFAVSISSQVTGATLSGTVSDCSGAFIPEAEISIKNAATGITKKVVADSVGYYTGIFDETGAVLANGYMDTLATQPREVQFY